MLLFLSVQAMSQTPYELKIETLVIEIASAIGTGKKIRIGVADFNSSETQTKFSRLLSEDLATYLVSLKNNQGAVIVINQSQLQNIEGYKESIAESDKALSLGKKKAASYLLFGKIIDEGSQFRIQVKCYDTQEGNLISAYKAYVEKSESLVYLHSQIVEESPDSKKTSQPITSQEEVAEKKEKKKREGKFWKFIGETAMSTGTEILNKTLEKKGSERRAPETNTPDSSDTGQVSDTKEINPVDCKVYINLINRTSDQIVVKVYKDNPHDNYNATPVFIYTIAVGKSKKQRVDKELTYYYSAKNNVGPLSGVPREYEGTFEVSECAQVLDEEIE
jgi:TolB-like protein